MTDDVKAPETPQDHAEHWLALHGSHISIKNFNKLVQFVVSKTFCSTNEATQAACIAMIRLGVHPNKFIWPYRPEFDIKIGDKVFGGRVVYDEWGAVAGKVTKVDNLEQFIHLVDDEYHTYELISYSSV